MTYDFSFWLGVACFSAFTVSVLVRLLRLWRNDFERLPVGGRWSFIDALHPAGFMQLAFRAS